MFKKLQLAIVVAIALGGIAQAQVGRTASTAAFMAGYLGYKYRKLIANLFSSKNFSAVVEHAPKNSSEIAPALSLEYSMSLIGKVPWTPLLLIFGIYSTYSKAGKPRTCIWGDYIKPHISSLCASLAGAAVLYTVDCIAGGNSA